MKWSQSLYPGSESDDSSGTSAEKREKEDLTCMANKMDIIASIWYTQRRSAT